MNKQRTLFLAITLTLLVVTSVAQSDDLDQIQMSGVIEEQLQQKTHVGVEVGLVTKKGQEFFSFGKTSRQPLAAAPNEKTIFEIGSISKVFTGILLAGLVNDGLLNLDIPISHYLSDLQGTEAGSITLRQLSTHTSGLPRLPTNFNPQNPEDPYADYTGSQMLAFLKGFHFEKTRSSTPLYSNLGVELIGEILTKASGQDYATLLETKITRPLGMVDTSLSPSLDALSRAAQGYDASLNKMSLWHMGHAAPAGGIKSTATDMLKFAGANLTPDLDTWLGRAILKSHEPLYGTVSAGIGFNWMLETTNEGPLIWHNGETAGFYSLLMLLPEKGEALFLSTNTATILQGVAESFLQKPFVLPREFKLTREEREKILGRYMVTAEVSADIQFADDLLSIVFTGGKPLRLIPHSPLELSLISEVGKLNFTEDGEKKITGVTLQIQGQTLQCPKVLSTLP